MKILKAPSPHFNERILPVDSIIIHYTDMPSADEALAWLSNPISKVSTHYLIDEIGQVYQLVEDDKRAWHAGAGYWQGCTDLNSCSIGIELANPGHSHGYVPFPKPQIDALLRLCEEICTRWDIPAARILGHSDIAPRRKQDPGHLFPWETLAKEGFGLWPSSYSSFRALEEGEATQLLKKIGYETTSPTHTLFAFQRHFQPHKVDGIVDNETLSLLYGVLKIF